MSNNREAPIQTDGKGNSQSSINGRKQANGAGRGAFSGLLDISILLGREPISEYGAAASLPRLLRRGLLLLGSSSKLLLIDDCRICLLRKVDVRRRGGRCGGICKGRER